MIHVFFTNKEVWEMHYKYVKSKLKELEEKEKFKLMMLDQISEKAYFRKFKLAKRIKNLN